MKTKSITDQDFQFITLPRVTDGEVVEHEDFDFLNKKDTLVESIFLEVMLVFIILVCFVVFTYLFFNVHFFTLDYDNMNLLFRHGPY